MSVFREMLCGRGLMPNSLNTFHHLDVLLMFLNGVIVFIGLLYAYAAVAFQFIRFSQLMVLPLLSVRE